MHYKKNGVCTVCDEPVNIVLLVVVGAAVFVLFSFTILAAYKKYKRWVPRAAVATLFIGLSFWQTTGLFDDVQFNWGESTRAFFQVASFSNFNIEVIRSDCYVHLDFETKFVLVLVGPFGAWFLWFLKVLWQSGSQEASEDLKTKVTAMLDEKCTSNNQQQFVEVYEAFTKPAKQSIHGSLSNFEKIVKVWFKQKEEALQLEIEASPVVPIMKQFQLHIFEIRSPKERQRFVVIQTVSMGIVLTIVCFVGVMSKILDVFDCQKHPNVDVSTLESQGDIICWQDRHAAFLVPVAVTFAVVYISFPLVVVYLLWSHQDRRWEEKSLRFEACEPFFRKYAHSEYYWEMLVLKRKGLLVGAVELFTVWPFRSMTLILSTLVFSMFITHNVGPYFDVENSRLEVIVLFCSVGVGVLGVLFNAPSTMAARLVDRFEFVPALVCNSVYFRHRLVYHATGLGRAQDQIIIRDRQRPVENNFESKSSG